MEEFVTTPPSTSTTSSQYIITYDVRDSVPGLTTAKASTFDEIVWNPEVTTQPSEKCYDDKHNVECEDVHKQEAVPKKDTSNRGMSGTMSLVIGIILGSFIAMILIVVIVLKVRTGVDMNEYKQEQMNRYNLTSPCSGTEKEDYPATDTGTTSLINGKNHNNNNNNGNGLFHGNNGNGLFNGSISSALNGDRARLFKKANSYGKPVREWYV